MGFYAELGKVIFPYVASTSPAALGNKFHLSCHVNLRFSRDKVPSPLSMSVVV